MSLCKNSCLYFITTPLIDYQLIFIISKLTLIVTFLYTGEYNAHVELFFPTAIEAPISRAADKITVLFQLVDNHYDLLC